MKQFTTTSAVKSQAVEFKLDGVLLRAYTPKNAHLLELATLDGEDEMTRTREVFAFIGRVLDDASRAHIKDRYDDPQDPFDLEDMSPIITFLFEEFTNRPTGSRTGSSSTRVARGKRSTATSGAKVSTRSKTSRPVGSAMSG